jgi:hypothetical protein
LNYFERRASMRPLTVAAVTAAAVGARAASFRRLIAVAASDF